MSPGPIQNHDHQHKIKSSRWKLALAGLITLALACSLGGPQASNDTSSDPPDREEDATTPIPPFARGVNMSPAGFPNDFSQLPAFYDEVASIPDAAVQWNGAWREDAASGTNAGKPPQAAIGLLREARSHGLLPVLVFGWRSGSNVYLRVPANSTNDWSNADARQLFAQMLAEVARQHQPPYMLLGNENDFYFEQAPDDYENWVAAYGEAYSAIKQASPDTRIGPVFNFEHLSGSGTFSGWETPLWGALEAHDMSSVDVVGLTLYPWMDAATPSEVPTDLLAPLFERIGDRQLVITETGWPAADVGDLDGPWQSSEQAQIDYLDALAAALPADRAAVVSWLFMHPMQDPGGQPVDWKLFSSLSLFDEQGNPRPVYEHWRTFTP